MAVSQHKRNLWCPGCGARCWKGAARLRRHMRNQCKSKATRQNAK